MEKIALLVWRDPEFRRKWLIGGVLAYIPILNLLLLGYYLRYLERLRRGAGVTLPDWRDPRGLVVDSVRALVPWLVYAKLPVLLAFLLSMALAGIFRWMGLGLFAWTLALAPLTVVAFIAPAAFCFALFAVVEEGSLHVLLDWTRVLSPLLRHGSRLIVPLLAFWGLLAVGWPLLGFAFFLGFGPLAATLCAVYLSHEA
jgi:hypothetical protein